MSVMQKLLEINDELVKVLEERARLQAQLAEVKNQLEAVVQERYNLQAELNTKDKQLQDVCSVKPADQNGLVRDVSHYTQAAEVDGPIEPQPEPQPQPVQVREGRWRKRSGAEVSVKAMPTDHDHFLAAFPWWDGDVTTWGNDGVFLNSQTASNDLVEYLGPTEPQQPAEPQEFNPYTFAAYIVGDKSQPDALRIVWATEEWIQHANFGIVHRMKDSFETLTLNLKVQ